MILAFASDYTRWRFPFVALGFFWTFLGFIIYASINVLQNLTTAYAACFMMSWGTAAPSVLLDVWYNNNIVRTLRSTEKTVRTNTNTQADENRRLLLTSIGVPVANLMGLVPSNIFRDQDAPNYIPALVTTAAFGATGIVLTLSLGFYMIFDNRRRDRKQGGRKRAPDVPTEILREGPKCDDFRWYY